MPGGFVQPGLFVLDLPVDDKGQGAPEQNHQTQNHKLAQLPDQHGPQHLAAQLELQGQGNALGQGEADVGLALRVADDAFHRRDQQNGYAGALQQQHAVLDD